jgi:intein/homing endonuclease
LSPEALVLTSIGWKQAKDLSVGDSLVTFSLGNTIVESLSENSVEDEFLNTPKLEQTKVTEISINKEILVGFNGMVKEASENQPVLVRSALGVLVKPAGEVSVGESLVSISESGEAQETIVETIEKGQDLSDVYDIKSGPSTWFLSKHFVCFM